MGSKRKGRTLEVSERINMSEAGKTRFEAIRVSKGLLITVKKIPGLMDDLDEVKGFVWGREENEEQATTRLIEEGFLESLDILPEGLAIFNSRNFPLEFKAENATFAGRSDICIAAADSDPGFPMFQRAALIISMKTTKKLQSAATQPQALLEILAIQSRYGRLVPVVITDLATRMHVFVPGDGKYIYHLANKNKDTFLTLAEGLFAIKTTLSLEKEIVDKISADAAKSSWFDDDDEGSEEEFVRGFPDVAFRLPTAISAPVQESQCLTTTGGGGGVEEKEFVEVSDKEFVLYHEAEVERKIARREAVLRSMPLVQDLERMAGWSCRVPRYVS